MQLTINLNTHLEGDIRHYLRLVHRSEGLTAEEMDEYLHLKARLGTTLLREVSAAYRYQSPGTPRPRVVHLQSPNPR